MDALDRVEPVARPLLGAVDTALVSLGAPPEHPIWGLLRRVGATPADAVAAVAGLAPDALREAGARLRGYSALYRDAVPRANVSWHGSAGSGYEATVAGLSDHLTEMVGRIGSTAAYLDTVADWQQAARDGVAEALALVLISAEALVLGRGDDAHTAMVRAAADVGAHVLAAVAAALTRGEQLAGPADPLIERAHQRPAVAPLPGPNAIEVS
jgi:uncharacterized protein YukE